MTIVPVGPCAFNMSELSTLLPMPSNDSTHFESEYIIGHIFNLANEHQRNRLFKYKFIETVGSEVHEHSVLSLDKLHDGFLLRKHVPIRSVALLGTKIYRPGSVDVSIPTMGIITAIALIRGYLNVSFRPIQSELLLALERDLRTKFTDYRDARSLLARFKYEYADTIGLETPTFMEGIRLMTGSDNPYDGTLCTGTLYDMCIKYSGDEQLMLQLLKSVFMHKKLLQPFGFAYDYQHGRLPHSNMFENYSQSNVRLANCAFPHTDIASTNYHDVHVSSTTKESLKFACMELIEIFDHMRLTDIDITLSCEQTAATMELRCGYSEITNETIIGGSRHLPESFFETANISISEFATAALDLEAAIQIGFVNRFNVVKRFDDTLSVSLLGRDNTGCPQWVTLHMNTMLSRAATPSICELHSARHKLLTT